MNAHPRMVDTWSMPKPLTKVCTRCGRRRPLGEYVEQDKYDAKGRSAGRGSHCLRCRVGATREWREANHDEVNEKKRAYEAREDVKARRRARDRARVARLRKERAQLRKAS